ncbi:hypothetical protein PYCCODRAFT_165249 [Trametes coccinea BRFM310]|uniref:BTB domain-containing protein n=1 Tax=Trametes coccinea (strain BRFM310) TaxID=1353009 RepID=A0A1Y2IS86_TRAC3|nr:hypothetical protein PYCCODRAFT_165249 [Trametes coccinea BRFM310]
MVFVLRRSTDNARYSVIEGGFSEGLPRGERRCGVRHCQRSVAETYEYDSDSDLEDDPEVSPLVTATDEHAASSASTSSLESNAFRSDHLRRLVDGSLETRQIVDAPTRDHVAQMDTAEAFPGLAIPFIVDIPNVAFRTFRALVYYAYTGIIHFAPMRSIEQSSEDENGPKASTLACSPKSMYRLADMYGLVELKELAADNIRSQLSERPKAALKELLSSFTARYPAVMALQLDLILRSQTRLECLGDLQNWADRVTSGELPHAGAALAELLRRLAQA